jgi:hypothetical protein
MPVTVEGKMVDGHKIVLDQPLANGRNEIIVRLKKNRPYQNSDSGKIRYDDCGNRYRRDL